VICQSIFFLRVEKRLFYLCQLYFCGVCGDVIYVVYYKICNILLGHTQFFERDFLNKRR
jgi:hypothetical protein